MLHRLERSEPLSPEKIWKNMEKNTLGNRICHRKMLWGENDEKPLGSAVLGISANAWNAEVNQI